MNCPNTTKKLESIATYLYDCATKENGVPELINDFHCCGVGFFILSHPRKTYLDGAVFICNKNPFVVYTSRYDRVDNFWFVIAHEIAHVLNHYDFLNEPFLDNLEEKSGREKKGGFFCRYLFKLRESYQVWKIVLKVFKCLPPQSYKLTVASFCSCCPWNVAAFWPAGVAAVCKIQSAHKRIDSK